MELKKALKDQPTIDRSEEIRIFDNLNHYTEHEKDSNKEEENWINFDDIKETEEDQDQEQPLDFSVPEIGKLRRALELNNLQKALKIFSDYPQLTGVFINKLFGFYFSIWYQREAIFNFLKGKPPVQATTSQLKIDQRAQDLIELYSYEDFVNNVDDSWTLLTEIAVYRSLDFNVKEIFSHGLTNNAQIKLRRSDVLYLIQYKHYEQIVLTFDKSIKKGLLKIFYDKELKVEEETFYHRYCLAFFQEVMIAQGYSDKEVLEFTYRLIDYFDLDQSVHAFIRLDTIDLFKWAEKCQEFKFKMEYFGQAISYEAFDIVLYLQDNYQAQITKQQAQIPYYTLSAIQRSNQYSFQKSLLVQKYFKQFSVYDFKALIDSLSHKIYMSKDEDNPFLYCLNPLALAVLSIYILREIAEKFKSLQVSCIQMEGFLERSILRYLDAVSEDEKVKFMMLEEIFEGKNSLLLLAEMRLYTIIQHRNAQEVINAIHRSEYSVEVFPIDVMSIFAIAKNESTIQDYDYEPSYRFYNYDWDRKHTKQNSMMFHIWKKSTLMRYNLEFVGLVVSIFGFQFVVVSFMSDLTYTAASMAYLTHFQQIISPNVDPFTVSLIYYHCDYMREKMAYMYYEIKLIELTLYFQGQFALKVLIEMFFIYKTKRPRRFLTPANVVQLVIGGIGFLYIWYAYYFPVETKENALLCRQYGGYDDQSYDQFQYLLFTMRNDQLVSFVLLLDVMFWFFFLLVQARIFQKFGTLLKIIFKMFFDFMKILVLYSVMLAIYAFFGFFVFSMVPGFSGYMTVAQFLFNATLGTFEFTVFQNFTAHPGLDSFIDLGQLGILYIGTWLILSNIMLLNLMIALFSDTYSKLHQIGEGLYLIEIIEVQQEKQYDEYYSGLISSPYPYSLLLLPLFPFYACIRNKKFNTFVLKCSHAFTMYGFVIPMLLILMPFAVGIAYIKSLANKFYLIFKSRKERTWRILEFLFFLFIGETLFIINSFFDFIKLSYILWKPEDQLQFRSHKEDVQMEGDLIDKMISYFKTAKITESGKKERTKNMIQKVQKHMKIHTHLSNLLVNLGSKKQARRSIKTFFQFKQFILNNSIEENKELFLYPQMVKGVVNDIQIRAQAIEKAASKMCQHCKFRPPSLKVANLSTIEKERSQSLEFYKMLLQSSIKISSKAFKEQKQLEQDELLQKLLHENFDKGLQYVDKYIQEGKESLILKYKEK